MKQLILPVFLLLLFAFFTGCGDDNNEPMDNDEVTIENDEEMPEGKERLMAVYKASINYFRSDEFKDQWRKDKDLDADWLKEDLAEIYRSFGYEGDSYSQLNKQVNKDGKKFDDDPEVKKLQEEFLNTLGTSVE